VDRVRVLIADDHPLFREGLARAVGQRPEFELAGEAHDGREALEQIRALAPDVAILDVRMPGLPGLEVLEALGREHLPTHVLILSAASDSAIVYAAIAAGAAGYLSKDADREAICDAISAIARGGRVLDPALQAGMFHEIHAREVDGARPVLSDREQQILRLTADGLTAPAIGKRLFLSTATVKTHLSHIYEKLGVNDRAAAVAEAMRRRLLE
jgi:two-component system nitrate/nitrite response regulator NarL